MVLVISGVIGFLTNVNAVSVAMSVWILKQRLISRTKSFQANVNVPKSDVLPLRRSFLLTFDFTYLESTRFRFVVEGIILLLNPYQR